MVINLKKPFYAVCIALVAHGCQEPVSTKIIHLPTFSSTDTVMQGTPAGMHLYMDCPGAVDLHDALQMVGFGTGQLQGLRVEQIRVTVRLPESAYDPGIIEGFNTIFWNNGPENTVIESQDMDFVSRTYVMDVRDQVNVLDYYGTAFSLRGGLRLAEQTGYNIVLTTEIDLTAEVETTR